MFYFIDNNLFVVFADPTATEDDDNADEDEDKYVDEVDMPGTKVYSNYLPSLYYKHCV